MVSATKLFAVSTVADTILAVDEGKGKGMERDGREKGVRGGVGGRERKDEEKELDEGEVWNHCGR